MNICKDCNIQNRHISKTGKKYSYCYECLNVRMSEYRKTEKGRKAISDASRKYRKTKNGKEAISRAVRDYQRKRNGFSKELFDERLISQSFLCAICEKEISDRSHADHNHETNIPRGILCAGCNTLLGRIESVGFEWVEKAKKYLDKY